MRRAVHVIIHPFTDTRARPMLRTESAVFYKAQEPALVRAQSNAQPEKTKKALVRRHSSGEHAFLPKQSDRQAIKAAQKNFGVPNNLVQDSEGSRLPTTRGY